MSNGGSLNLNYLPSVVGLSVSGSGTLTLNGNWENDQTLSFSGATLTFNGSWHNAGTINATNATVNLGGAFTVGNLGGFNASDTAVNLVGTLNNTNTTLNAASGQWFLSGGAVEGGTISTANGASFIVQSGTLDGVTVNGTLDVGNNLNGATLTVSNGLVLNGTALVGNPSNGYYGRISFAGSQVLGGSGTVVFGNNGNAYNVLQVANAGTTLVIGAGIEVHGQTGLIGYTAAWGGGPQKRERGQPGNDLRRRERGDHRH